MSRGAVQREERVVERGRRTPKPAHQPGRAKLSARRGGASESASEPLDLSGSAFDQERLGKQTYLTVPQLMAYGQFKTKKATYCFLAAHPEIRRGYGRIFRRDVDLALQSRSGRHAAKSPSPYVAEQR